jgi:DNA-dependent RNA polymerase auxiliary subunit epsilon
MGESCVAVVLWLEAALENVLLLELRQTVDEQSHRIQLVAKLEGQPLRLGTERQHFSCHAFRSDVHFFAKAQHEVVHGFAAAIVDHTGGRRTTTASNQYVDEY